MASWNMSRVNKIGAKRIIFGSDSYWIDVRCMLGMLLKANAPMKLLWDIVRNNAIKAYHPETIASIT